MDTKKIRKQMKQETGYNARQVTVRNSHGSLYFTVRAGSVDFEKVQKFARQFENVHRCEYSGSILSGGNTFVFVETARAVKDEYKAAWLPALEEVAKGLSGSTGLTIPGTDYALSLDRGAPNSFVLWHDHSSIGRCYGLDSVAVELGKRNVAQVEEVEEIEQPEEDTQEQEIAPAADTIEDDEAEEMNEYEQRQERKRERYEELADKAEARSNSRFKEARRIGSHIPFGQPILVGHHSEGRARRDAASITRNMGKGVEESRKADHYRRKAESVGKGGISSDDPAAVKKLKKALVVREKNQVFMKALNKAWRKAGKPKADNLEAWAEMAEYPEVKALGFTKMEEMRQVYAGDFMHRAPFTYELTNNNANIKRIKERIKSLEYRKEKPAAEDKTGEVNGIACTLHENTELNRVQLIFDGKPPAEVRISLKRSGFRWSPKNKAWQRHLNQGGIYAAHSLLNLS